MGLTHSSAVVDSCLFTLVAMDWAARVDVQLAHAVKMFVRLRDDIFIVTSDLAKLSRVFPQGTSSWPAASLLWLSLGLVA